ncbi:DeoR family transcriptional regulator [Cnuibacter physcomitrellae]|uniref:Transcriptional regulator n=1 Tax=Cnuibacter physcomitrellae TaxID=1619308 RepID=A0A1X9LFN3_9MICO|nr:WYL domain-containing protein [Cnuibacter physcomitrellae]ARJ03947.1 transcriptional regulator [Cnuibacter physcomitrellae]GGI39873.1 DeoR family transcriptional regulator [Cnuibacter physcomitrellae]
MTASSTSRLLRLLSLLQMRRDWPGPVLAERLEISHRTVRRDVDRLREMGYSISSTMGPEGGYRLDAGDDLPPLLFDDDQVIALAVALQAAAVTGVGIEDAALRALTTVRQVMPSRLRHRLGALEFTTVTPRPGAVRRDPVSPDVLIALSTAVRAREVLRFDYASHRPRSGSGSDGDGGAATDPAPPRKVEPHHLLTSGGSWYLVAWDLDRDAWRIYRADRISPRTPTGPRFAPREVPGGDVAEYVSARFKGSESGDRWPCIGKAILHLPARDVLPFAEDGIVEDLGPDRCSLEVGSWSWIALASALGRFDTEIEVVSPAELTAAFGVLAARHAATAGR